MVKTGTLFHKLGNLSFVTVGMIALVLSVTTALFTPATPRAYAAGYDDCKTTVLRVGSTKVACIKYAQTQLNTFRYCMTGVRPLVVDGVFGTKTKTLTMEFQNYVNINADGVIGSKTWPYLRTPCIWP